MKRVIAFLFLFLSVAAVVSAQDVLVTEDGESITAYDVDISGAQKIYYKTAAGEEAPMKSIAKEKVLLWKKADGTKVRIGKGKDAKQTPTSVSNDEKTPAPDVSDPQANAAAIVALTKKSIVVSANPLKKKAAKRIFGALRITPESPVVDKNLEMSFNLVTKEDWAFIGMKKGSYVAETIGIACTVKNKSDKTIFVYLGNTYFLRHGVAIPITQAYASQSAGTGQATGFSQNVLAIPPHSSLNLGSFEFFPKGISNPFGFPVSNDFTWIASKESSIRVGEERNFASGEVPVDFGMKVAYSFNEGDTQLNQLDAHFYCSKLVGSAYTSSDRFDGIIAAGLYFIVKQEVKG